MKKNGNEPHEPRAHEPERLNPKQALAVLAAAFRVNDLSEPTIGLYISKLQDIAEDLLGAVIHRLIEEQSFFPTIGRIRRLAAEMARVLPVSAEEAAAIVRAADVDRPVTRRDGTYAYTEREWDWPGGLSDSTLRVIREALEKLGDPVGITGERVFGWDRDFKALYARVAEERTALALADLSHATLPRTALKT